MPPASTSWSSRFPPRERLHTTRVLQWPRKWPQWPGTNKNWRTTHQKRSASAMRKTSKAVNAPSNMYKTQLAIPPSGHCNAHSQQNTLRSRAQLQPQWPIDPVARRIDLSPTVGHMMLIPASIYGIYDYNVCGRYMQQLKYLSLASRCLTHYVNHKTISPIKHNKC